MGYLKVNGVVVGVVKSITIPNLLSEDELWHDLEVETFDKHICEEDCDYFVNKYWLTDLLNTLNREELLSVLVGNCNILTKKECAEILGQISMLEFQECYNVVVPPVSDFWNTKGV